VDSLNFLTRQADYLIDRHFYYEHMG
jgi:hypothetical protein